jgi:hypothetical protein
MCRGCAVVEDLRFVSVYLIRVEVGIRCTVFGAHYRVGADIRFERDEVC